MTTAGLAEQAEAMFFEMKQLELIEAILTKLGTELDSCLTYHSLEHTLDVIHEALLFGIHDKLEKQQLKLLAIAAAFHDSGFLIGRENHENRSAELAREMMEEFGKNTPDEINQVCDMIIDTKLVHTKSGKTQIPSTFLSSYLLDADLSNFGRQDFFDKSEQLRSEWDSPRIPFLRETYSLIREHTWFTPAAYALRQKGQEKNIKKLSGIVKEHLEMDDESRNESLRRERLEFLARLPLLINNTLEKRKVLKVSVEYAKKMVSAEAATIFLKQHGSQELVFWAPQGGDSSRLEGKRMPASKGIVGWVLENQQSIVVKDVSTDPRFFSRIDNEGEFKTRNLICVPLTVRGSSKLGALQILNKEGTGTFHDQDVLFIEQFAHQLALAIDNAQLHQQVVRRKKQLEELGKRKSEMLRVLSHELKTPVTIIQSAAELLSGGLLTDATAIGRIKETLDKGVDRITKVAQQLSNVAFLGDDTTLKLTDFEITELLKETCSQFKEIAAERNLTISIDDDTDSALVNADRNLIHMVLCNLVSNSIRFTDDTGAIVLGCKTETGMARVSVRDNGIGFEDDKTELIFEKFYEIADSKHHSSGDFEFKSGGLGLGLASVKTILEAHEASITVESTPGEGSCFTFCLPLSES